jgi:hypothetical protein
MVPASIMAASTATPARRHPLTVFRRAELISITSAVVPFRSGSIIPSSVQRAVSTGEKANFLFDAAGKLPSISKAQAQVFSRVFEFYEGRTVKIPAGQVEFLAPGPAATY